MKEMHKLLHHAIWYLEEKMPKCSMRLWVKKNKLLYFLIIPLLMLIQIIIYPKQSCFVLFIILNFFYLITQLFKLWIVIIGNSNPPSKDSSKYLDNLPIYTILLPVYREEKILQNLINSIHKIDYPKHLLDVKLLVEEDDIEVLKAITLCKLPNYFEIVKIPVSFPRTKPKACNYGLQLAKGKYTVIYDAEDKPHPQQLKQVVYKFSNCSNEVICIQALLNYYNRQHNYLSKNFSLEYSLLFEYILPGLQKLNMPIPLGGSSNHFITDQLQKIGGWDAFNVTEDADLGIRLYNQGYRCELINSETLEEATVTLKTWIKQRSRWIKGHLLTSLLHLNQLNNMSVKHIFGVIMHLYIPNLTYILLPIYLLLRCFVSHSNYFDYLFYINIGLGISLPIIYNIYIALKKDWHDMKLSIILSPLYYLLFQLSAIKACYQIFTKPFHWDKTTHGHSNKKSSKT